MELEPCTASEACARAVSFVGQGQYLLGAGDYRPYENSAGDRWDEPWTTSAQGYPGVGADCCGFAHSFCWKVPRHRLGFNRGAWATVSDDVNCDSLLEDAQHKQELAQLVHVPAIGDLVITPTIKLYHDGSKVPYFDEMGHVRIVVGISRVRDWDPARPTFYQLDLVEIFGPNYRKPGVVRTTGARVDEHNHKWPKAPHRAQLVRPRERV